MADLDELKTLYRRSVEALIQGDPQLQEVVWARRDDVTLANPLGPPARGWESVSRAITNAASQISEGEEFTFDEIAAHETADLAYDVGIERCVVKLGGAAKKVAVSLRVTTIFGRVDGDWKVFHRHADPITQARPIQSIVPSDADA